MKHPSIRDLLEYWNERRGRRAAPERDDIEPEAIRGLLADTFILSIDPVRGHPFRLAGTRVCALLGREIKGQAFLDLFSPATRTEIRQLFAIIADETVGVAGGARELIAEGPEAAWLELLLLPLRHYGRTDTRLLGALAANGRRIGWGPGRSVTWSLVPIVSSAVAPCRLVLPRSETSWRPRSKAVLWCMREGARRRARRSPEALGVSHIRPRFNKNWRKPANQSEAITRH